jgi:tripartite-type tricarboxylate transporter receptor subunit TctC
MPAVSSTSLATPSKRASPRPALADTIAGHTQVIVDCASTSIENVRGGTVRALAQSGTTRSPLLPDVPTMREAGVPGYESIVYNALLGPAGLPRDIIEKLQAEVAKVGRDATLQERFAKLGLTMTASTPERNWRTSSVSKLPSGRRSFGR